MDSGTISQLVFVIFGAAVFVYGLVLHNDLSSVRDANDRARAKLEAILRNLYDEIPGLLEVINQSSPNHDSASQALAQAHVDCLAASSIAQKSVAHAKLEKVLEGFVGANPNFVEIQNRIAELNERISATRESYNQDVAAYNARIGQFPEAFVASIMGLQRREAFLASE